MANLVWNMIFVIGSGITTLGLFGLSIAASIRASSGEVSFFNYFLVYVVPTTFNYECLAMIRLNLPQRMRSQSQAPVYQAFSLFQRIEVGRNHVTYYSNDGVTIYGDSHSLTMVDFALQTGPGVFWAMTVLCLGVFGE